MRCLLVYCHPVPESFCAALRDAAAETLRARGWELRLVDLYADGFQPVLSPEERRFYDQGAPADPQLQPYIESLRWADAILFVYPTWWYGLPAMLKGWLDRVLLPEVAFHMPSPAGGPIRPGLTHISGLGVFTTCGASPWLTLFVGAPGKRQLVRGVGLLLAPGRRTVFAAHYRMDSSTEESRRRHLARVAAKVDRLTRGAATRRTELEVAG